MDARMQVTGLSKQYQYFASVLSGITEENKVVAGVVVETKAI